MSPDAPRGQVVTFYSYKGGTGRSMALANIGYILASDRRTAARGVLLIDWDLEAPGLHRFFSDASSDGNARAYPFHKGLLDFFEVARAQYGSAEMPAEYPDIQQRIFDKFDTYVTPTRVENLSLMHAGKLDDRSYADRIRRFDWEAFHEKDPTFFSAFRHYLATKYSVVLIDSRTGLTDTSGICARQMPDKLVLVFAPNHQNIDGVLEVARKVKAFQIADSLDPRPISIWPLASRIDGNASILRDKWRKGGEDAGGTIEGYQRLFEELFIDLYELDECNLDAYFDATQVAHDSDYAYGERIASERGTTDRLTLGYAYAGLARRLTSLDNPWERLPEEHLIQEARRGEAEARQREEEARKARNAAEEEAAATKARLQRLVRRSLAAAAIGLLAAFLYAIYVLRPGDQPGPGKDPGPTTATNWPPEVAQPVGKAWEAKDPAVQASYLAPLATTDIVPPPDVLAFVQKVASQRLPAMVVRRPGVFRTNFDGTNSRMLTVSLNEIVVSSLDGKEGVARFTPDSGQFVDAAMNDSGTRTIMLWSWRDYGKDNTFWAVKLRGIFDTYERRDTSWSSNGQVAFTDRGPVTISDSGVVTIWTNNTPGKPLFTMPSGVQRQIAVSADGRTVAALYRDDLKSSFALTWELPGGRPLRRLDGIPPGVIALSPNGRYLAATTTAGGVVLDLQTGERRGWSGPVQPVNPNVELAISADGLWVAYEGAAGTVGLQQTVATKPNETAAPSSSSTLWADSANVSSLAFVPNHLVTSGGDGRVKFWPITPPTPPQNGSWTQLIEYFKIATAKY